MPWEPRSQRNDPSAYASWQGPYSGVPEWLGKHLDDWIFNFFYINTIGGIEHYADQSLVQLELDLHLDLSWKNGARSAARSAITFRVSNEETYLDIVDWCVAHADDDSVIAELQRLLDGASSVYTITRRPGSPPILTERVDPIVENLVQRSAPDSSRTSTYLGLAWSQIYGLKKDPSSGYRNAIRAVEAAAKPTVSPSNALTTLGSIIGDISQNPTKWKMTLRPDSGVDPIEVVLGMMRLIWKSQLDRHGTDDEAVPISVTPEEAEAALHIAAQLVQLFVSGAISLA